MAEGGEKAWVKTWQPRLEIALQALSFGGVRVRVNSGYKLPYAYEILGYEHGSNKPSDPHTARYETDLLIYDEHENQRGWIPRVVVECKLGAVTTHDALTYSAKAATHKHVHPYVRYGIVIGNFGAAVPPRLVRHGAYFDFMTVWGGPDASERDWGELVDVLLEEVRASRVLRQLLTDKSHGRESFRLLHRPLRFK